jgi:Glycosyltransferase like family
VSEAAQAPATSQPGNAASTAQASQPQAIGNPELIVLEALKIAHTSTGAARYLEVYQQLRGRIEHRHASGPAATPPPSPPQTAPASVPGTGATSSAAQPVAPAPIRLVCATREDREGFYSSTALGRSLKLHRPAAVDVRLFPRNARGLPAVYNMAIAESAPEPAILLFVHDDVHLCDLHWADNLRRALGEFDIVGLAGNRRRVPRQPGWAFVDEKLTLDKRAHLSGTVAHGRGFPPEIVEVFGPSGQRVTLLDGLFLAVRSETVAARSLRFDERFEFHFYDLDFCRQAERAGLRMGTWPISVVHESAGDFASDRWRRGYEVYLEKWRD